MRPKIEKLATAKGLFTLGNLYLLTYVSVVEKFGKDSTIIQRFIQMAVKGKYLLPISIAKS